MNIFDKSCAVFSFVLGGLLLLLGVMGLFVGCNANFTLPPILGVIPAFVGWGIVRSIWVAWRSGGEFVGLPEPRSPLAPPTPEPEGRPV